MIIYIQSKDLDDQTEMVLHSTHKKATSKTASEMFGTDLLQCNSCNFTIQISVSAFCFIHIEGSWYLLIFSVRGHHFYVNSLVQSHFLGSVIPQPTGVRQSRVIVA
ncbi:hypothetical protein XENOCAPTIV_022970 [Xenoophorus captivus]|uniref:Uncharacterized protein n=1 Tax=Xenoophorus captivus TaxID=1517983 RepID=A0ABV0S2F3_9TELE